MGIFGNFFCSQCADEPLDAQQEDIKKYVAACKAKSHAFLVYDACDEIPNATGQFGYSETNPIPVNGPMGECVYLNRLRSRSGARCLYHRIGSLPMKTVNQANMRLGVDMFEVVAGDASQWAILYFLMYYPHRSQKCPDDFTMISWTKMTPADQLCSKLPCFGNMFKVDDFPLKLPEAIENNDQIKSSIPGFNVAFANIVREMLSKQTGRWQRPS
jgi:hypothetical protein